MNIKRNLVLAGAVASISAASIGGIGVASAATNTDASNSLIDKIATKFNLNKDEVKAVFDEEHAVRETERQQEQSERLQNLVDNGKITAEQKTQIEAKMKEFKTAREAERDELEKWADDNNIDMKYLMGGRHNDDEDLQQAVDNKEITADQKTLIEQKRDELKDKRQASRDELEKWAYDNNIDMKYLMGGMKGRGGPGGPGRM